MRTYYFRHRKLLNFNRKSFDVGEIFFWRKGHEDLYFILSIPARTPDEYDAFYKYHLETFLARDEGNNEKDFFRHVSQIVQNYINQMRLKSISSDWYKYRLGQIEKLELFTEYLEKIDRWSTGKSKDTIIAEKEFQIKFLSKENDRFDKELKEVRKHDTDNKITISKDQYHVVIDLFNQMQALKLPDGKPLMVATAQSAFIKMLCKYFENGLNNPINSETARRYFKSPESIPSVKFSEVPDEYHLFNIVPIKKRA